MSDDWSSFLGEIHTHLRNRGRASTYNASQAADALVRAMDAPAITYTQQPITMVTRISEDALDQVSDSRMIHEMLRRGYAVMTVPGGGKPAPLEEWNEPA